MTHKKSAVECLISDGFPFFKGDITLSQSIEISDTDYELILPDGFLTVEVKINGQYAGKMMFSNRLDISKYLSVGKNEIELTVTAGLRNLLGPFHDNEGEPGFVGPDTFERLGSWQNGKSNRYNPKYAFKKGII